MSEAHVAIYDVHERRSLIAGTATPSQWQVREDNPFYVPDLLSDEDFDSGPKLRAAEYEHARHLRKAQAYLDEVLNLVGVLLASLGDEGDTRAMQAETMLKIIERKLQKANIRIDRHDRRHTNLFYAYFDLKQQATEGGDK